ncbi:MAG: metallophosphoesterase family protein, partial [Nitrospirota bacterium]
MRYAVIADVHANLEALEAVLKDIKKRKIESILFLGDAV